MSRDAAPNMGEMLSERPHYFANTSIFLSPDILEGINEQINAIESVIKSPGYRAAVMDKPRPKHISPGVFMGYDFHITQDGPRLIEINTNAGGAFIVDMIEQTNGSGTGKFGEHIADMFRREWEGAGRSGALKTIAIVDTAPKDQFHYPDMCLAKTLLEDHGLSVVITDPSELHISKGQLFFGRTRIDMIYNRLTDFDLSEPENAVVRQAFDDGAAVVTPAPHHHRLYADKRNLILLSDSNALSAIGASPAQIRTLAAIPTTRQVTAELGEQFWAERKSLFFKPQAGFGSRGAFRGAKLTKRVWGEILEGGYIAQARVSPPLRAVTVDDAKSTLKFDVRIYTYDGQPLILGARIYQGQTTNLRTQGGGLAAVIPIASESFSSPQHSLNSCRRD